ncbi:MAG: alpha/beta hydrolase [Thermoanaerobaculia bacterium]|nr:alpha/beta hydrolase [Thermoanaerobaculia bacterium]
MSRSATAIESPPLLRLALEARAGAELGLFHLLQPVLEAAAPEGDGHPVLVLPGLGADDRSTAPLRRFLRRKGWDARGWELGRNPGPSVEVQAGVVRRLFELTDGPGGRASLVGWSLGGIYAREMAKRHPRRVRSVVTLGSPFRAGERSPDRAGAGRRLGEPPPVPSTAIYSLSDAVVAWHACLEPETGRTENIRVPGAHCGLGHNPLAVLAIADRLAQDPETWRPFDEASWRALLYPPHVRRRSPSRPGAVAGAGGGGSHG